MGRWNFHIPNKKTLRMDYWMTSNTHSQAVDSTKGCVTARGFGNCNEIGIIPCRRWWMDGTSLDTVVCFDDWFGITHEREG
jgi:hypothetical protein